MSTVASTVDWQVVGTNAGLFFLAVSAAIGGIYTGIKNMRKDGGPTTPQAIVGATIMENTTMLMLSTALRDLRDEIVELRHAVTTNTDAVNRAATTRGQQ